MPQQMVQFAHPTSFLLISVGDKNEPQLKIYLLEVPDSCGFLIIRGTLVTLFSLIRGMLRFGG